MTSTLPKRDRVDVRLNLVSEKTELMVEVVTVDGTKLGALGVLTVRVEVKTSFDTI